MEFFLCLEFANTIVFERKKLIDLIPSFDSLTQWCMEKNLVTPGELSDYVNRLRISDRARLVESAKDFRDSLREMVEKIRSKKEIPVRILEIVNQLLAQQSGYSTLAKTQSGFEIRKHRDLDQPEQILIPIAESTAKLLCEADFRLLKKCSNPECTLYFYDFTKNHRRRWCSMQTCGNRMKVDAYWKRKRSPTI